MAQVEFQNFENLNRQRKGSLSWIKTLSDEAASQVRAIGLPHRAIENWKYTNLNFLNDFSGEISNYLVPGTQRFSEISETERLVWENIRTRLNDWQKDNLLENLNLAFLDDASYLRVPKNEKMTLNLDFTAKNLAALSSPRLFLNLEENSELNVYEESCIGSEEILNSFCEANLAPGARLNFIRHQKNSPNSHQISTLRVLQAKDTHFEYFHGAFGSKLARDNVFCLLEGENASCELKGISLSKKGQHLDQYVFVDHAVPKAKSRQVFKNIVGNQSRAVFNGRVLVRKYSKGSDARQLNRNLLLGPKAEINTRPQLEILNDDVKCSHGATIGRPDPEELFYLESRGISNSMSLQMLCRAFAEELLGSLENREVAGRLSKSLNSSFSEVEGQNA